MLVIEITQYMAYKNTKTKQKQDSEKNFRFLQENCVAALENIIYKNTKNVELRFLYVLRMDVSLT